MKTSFDIYLWQSIIPNLMFVCEYLWLTKVRFIGLVSPLTPVTYAIITNTGSSMCSPGIVTYLSEKGCV